MTRITHHKRLLIGRSYISNLKLQCTFRNNLATINELRLISNLAQSEAFTKEIGLQ